MSKKRYIEKITVVLAVGLLSACSSMRHSTPTTCIATTINTPSNDIGVMLSEAARSVSQSLNELKILEKTVSPPGKLLPYPTASGLGRVVASVDWAGPIEPLLRRIATLVNYRLEVIGRQPAIPVLVSINAQNTPLAYIIRNADIQAGNKGSVTVYPGIRTIELRYAKNQF